ncbi:MAG: Bax inhibitor-1 family protein, partial [Lachnospiraceae bacterium]|nr:Bax inhibitor-1 family protein [Lachnospiraceae bacterium]
MDQNFNNPYNNQFNNQYGGQNQFNAQYGNQYNQFNAQYGNQYNNAYADQNPYAQANAQYNNQYSQFNAQYNNQYSQFTAQNAGFNGQYGGAFVGQGFQPGMGQAMPGRNGGPASFSGIVSEVTETLQQKVVAKSFLYMVVALIVTAIAAFAAPQAMAKILITHPSAIFGLVGLELVIVIVSNIAIKKNNAALTVVLYTVYSFLTGATLGVVFWAYQLGSVVAIFLMTSAIFAIMAVYGMVTKRDLSSLGSILLMSILGIIIV